MGIFERFLESKIKNTNRSKILKLVSLIPCQCLDGVLWAFQKDSSGF